MEMRSHHWPGTTQIMEEKPSESVLSCLHVATQAFSLLSHHICVTYYIKIKPECEKEQYMQLAHHLKEFVCAVHMLFYSRNSW